MKQIASHSEETHTRGEVGSGRLKGFIRLIEVKTIEKPSSGLRGGRLFGVGLLSLSMATEKKMVDQTVCLAVYYTLIVVKVLKDTSRTGQDPACLVSDTNNSMQ